MSLRTLFANKNLIPTPNHPALSPNIFSKFPKFPNDSITHFRNHILYTTQQPHRFLVARTKNASFQEPYGTSQEQGNGTGTSNEFNFDSFLSILEFLSLTSSVAVSVYLAVTVSFGLNKGGGGLSGLLCSKFLVWQCVVLVSGVVVGAVIRRRQWRRICGVGISSSSSYAGNLLERVEKLEEDLRSYATITRVMSRQLEKLGIRFRVTRKTLKEPIAEAAALAQKNSEATRALAAQEEHLEKELGEIQKVLMAMQEQQQKQLELILAIGKAGKLWETKRTKSRDENSTQATKSPVDGTTNSEINYIGTVAALQKEASNDRP